MTKSAKAHLIHYEKNQLDCFHDFLWGHNENILVAEDVEYGESNGGVQKVSLLVTFGVFYLFELHEFSEVKLLHELTIIDLEKISYSEPDGLTLTYKDEDYTIKTDDALSIGQLLVNQFELFNYQIHNAPTLTIESNPPSKLIPATPLNFRPSSLFQNRLVIYSHYYKSQYQSQNVKIFKDWDQKHSGTLTVDSSYDPKGDARPLARAISSDADITHLVIDNFAPDQFGTFISTIFEYSSNLNHITFKSIPSSIQKEFDFSSSTNKVINNITFRDSHADSIIAFINSLEKYEGEIQAFKLSNIQLAKEEISDIIQSLSLLSCFSNLQTLSFDVLKVKEFPVQDFSALLPQLNHLTSLTVKQIDAEGSELYNRIMSGMQTPKHIEIIGMKFTVKIEAELPESVTYLNLSESELDVDTFLTLINSIFTKPRTTPLFLTASDLKGASTNNFLQNINFSELAPVLYELNWDSNHLSVGDIANFVKFLKTQTELKFLSLNKCFNKEDDPEKSLQAISNFLHETPIQGLSLQGDDKSSSIPAEALISFLSSMSGCHGLKCLHLTDSKLGESGIDHLIKFVNDSPDLTEVDFDGIGVSSANELLRFYNRLLMDPKITSCAWPEEFNTRGIDQRNRTQEIKKILAILKTKKAPKTPAQRLESVEHEQTDLEEVSTEEGFNFEKILTLIPPSSLSPKAPVATFEGTPNPLEELDAMVRSMVAVMRDEQPERQVEPLPMAKMIMDHLSTTKTILKSSQDIAKYPY